MTAAAIPVPGGIQAPEETVSAVGDFLYIQHAREIVFYLHSETDYEEEFQELGGAFQKGGRNSGKST